MRSVAPTALLLTLAACGGVVDQGSDAAPPDATSPQDADASVDATVAPDASDASLEAQSEAEADAPEAAPPPPPSQPWGLDVGSGYPAALAVDKTTGHVAVGLFDATGSYTGSSLQCYDSAGSLLWSKNVEYANVRGVALDSAGDVYAVADAGTNSDFGGGPTSKGAVLVKYDATGAFLWQYGPFYPATFSKVAVKSNGDVVIGGACGAVDFGGGPVPFSGSYIDVLVAEVTPSSSYVRAEVWPALGNAFVTTLALDSSDDIVVSGWFDGTLDFGGGPMTGPAYASGSLNSFIAKLDPSAQYLHQLHVLSTSDNRLASVALDSSGDVLVCGSVTDQVNLGGKNLLSAGNTDVLVGKLDPSLGHLWSKRFGDAQQQDCEAIAVDVNDDVVFAGRYLGGLNFGLGYLAYGSGNTFWTYVARFDPFGVPKADVSGFSGVIGGMEPLVPPDFVMFGTCSGSVYVGSSGSTCKTNLTTYESFLLRFEPP